MTHKLFPTQEVGSLMRPGWNQWDTKIPTTFNRSLTTNTLKFEVGQVGDAINWGRKLGVDTSELVHLIRKGTVGPLSAEEKEYVVRKAVEMAVRLQELAGLDRIYNGEQTRTEMYNTFVRQTQGMVNVGTVNSFDWNYYIRGAMVGDVSISPEVVRMFVDEFKFVQSLTDREVKPCITGAYTLMDWSYTSHYKKLAKAQGFKGEEALMKGRELATLALAKNVVNPIVRGWADAGAKVIQSDEPAATTDERESELYVESKRLEFAGVHGVVRANHLCFSEYPVLFPYLADAPIDLYLVEFTNHVPPGQKFDVKHIDPRSYELLRLAKEYSMDASFAVGVVDIHRDDMETPGDVRDKLMAAGKIRGDNTKIEATPDCGLRTRTLEVAQMKLDAVVQGARLARREFGEE